MDFETTKRLLEEGANPETTFDDESDSCWNHVCTESSLISTDFPQIENEEIEPFERFEVFDLIGYAAYESMYSLLKPYIRNR